MTVDAACNVDALIEAYTHHARRVRELRDRTLHQHAALAPCDVMTFVASLKGVSLPVP